MKISFLFFARSRELAGTDTYDVELADGTGKLPIYLFIILQSISEWLHTNRRVLRRECVACVNFQDCPVLNQVLPPKMPCKRY